MEIHYNSNFQSNMNQFPEMNKKFKADGFKKKFKNFSFALNCGYDIWLVYVIVWCLYSCG